MEKITTTMGVVRMTNSFRASMSLGFAIAGVTDENFWQVREQARMMSGDYTPLVVYEDDKCRFLHVSTDDPTKVAYTKDADKGRADIQTRTTLAAYCEKFGLQESTHHVTLVSAARIMQGEPETPVSADADTSNVEHCMAQLTSAIGRVNELKLQLRTLLGG